MVDKYLLRNFKLRYPSSVEEAIDIQQRGPTELVATMVDGSIAIYDDSTESIRIERNTLESDPHTDEEWNHEFSGRLLAAIRSRGWTQKDLAEELGVSQPTIASYLNGRTLPNIRIMSRIAHILRYTVSDLIDFE